MPRVLLGTQGWSYPDWVGSFYAPGTRAESFLPMYAAEFATVEIDSTFYGTPDRRTVRRWRAIVPAGFEFSLKVPREITHERRLVGTDALLAEFFDVARELGPALGCVLVQFEANFGRDNEPEVRHALEAVVPRDVRVALEFRDPAWYDGELLQHLNDCGVALAVADAPFVPRALLAQTLHASTAEHAYVRWIGDHDAIERYDRVQIAREEPIAWWGRELAREPLQRKRIYGYVNNHYQGHSPATVRALYDALGIAHAIPARPEQISLF